MKVTRKIVSITTIVLASLAVLQLILKLDGDMPWFGGLNTFLTIATLAIAGFFALNSLNMISKSKTLGIVSLSLISVSAIMVIIAFWVELDTDMFTRITISFALLSVLFNIIVSSGLDLGKNSLVIQIIVYIIAGAVDLIATLALFGVIKLGDILPLFWALVLLCALGIVILKVLAKRLVSKDLEKDKDLVKISSSEYATLVEKAKKYDELMAKTNSENK